MEEGGCDDCGFSFDESVIHKVWLITYKTADGAENVFLYKNKKNNILVCT